MTARRIAEERVLVRQHAKNVLLFFAVIAVLVFVAYAPLLFGQDFRTADQIYLPSAIHIGQWATDARITNETDDPVSISVRYVQANTAPVIVDKLDIIKLLPREYRDVTDALGSFGLSGMGQLVFTACLDGADCSYGALNAESNYRNISVGSRTYLRAANGGTSGQDMPGLPRWAYGDRNYAMKIVGINVGPQYRTNVGLVNTSQYAGLWLTVTLRDGPSHAVRDQASVHLRPMEPHQQPVTELFPKLGEWSRLNRGRATTSAYITVALAAVEPVAGGVPAGCFDSCAAFVAYGSLIDTVSGAAITLEATFEGAGGTLSVGQVDGLFPGSAGSSGTGSSGALRTAATASAGSVWCTVEPVPKTNYYRVVMTKDGSVLMHVTAEEQEKARAMCGAAAGAVAQ
jgi:hypothetical protein